MQLQMLVIVKSMGQMEDECTFLVEVGEEVVLQVQEEEVVVGEDQIPWVEEEGGVEEDPLLPMMEEVVEVLVGGHYLVWIVVEQVVEVRKEAVVVGLNCLVGPVVY